MPPLRRLAEHRRGAVVEPVEAIQAGVNGWTTL
jgi:hypothetical protein